MILKSYLHIKTCHLVKILPTTPTCFSLSGRTPAKEHRYNLHSYTHAAAVPYILSIEALATGLDRLKHVGVVGSILTK